MGSQKDMIRQTLEQRVRTGLLIPGDAIDEKALRKEFDVSGTPVREALVELEVIGLIERSPRAGARIFRPGIERLIGLIELHAELEGTAVHFAARRISRQQGKALLQTVEACEAFVADPLGVPEEGYYQLNINFHMQIMEATNNEDLCNAMTISANRIISYFRASHRLRGEPLRSANEHRLIAEAILASESDTARSLMIQHVIVDGASILDVVKKMDVRF